MSKNFKRKEANKKEVDSLKKKKDKDKESSNYEDDLTLYDDEFNDDYSSIILDELLADEDSDEDDIVLGSISEEELEIERVDEDEGFDEKMKTKTSKKRKNKNQKKKEPKEKKKKRKWWKKLLSFFLICFVLGVFAVFSFCIYIVYSCDEFDPNALANQDQTLIYDNKGAVIAKLGIEKRESVTYDKLPQVLIDAIIATEDSKYFVHNGVNGARFLKASVKQLLGDSSAGGASTLTMQVVKNNLTSTERTITRKFKDIYLAVFFMEKNYTKEEILEFYVNDSYLGGSVYGVEEASKYYFGKSVSELSLPEAALIAGLFQAPSSYNPYNYPEAAAKRRNTVLSLMVRHGYITEEEAEIANSVDVTSMLAGNSKKTSYQGFIDTVVAEVKKKTGYDPALVSMEIFTTMDANIQDGINKIFTGSTYTYGNKKYKWKDEKIQAGATIIDVNTGAIVAVGTGRNRTGERELNYATKVYRQPGSTAKPIFAYAPGFEFDNFSTYQLFVDEKWSYSDGTHIGNWDNKYKGVMTLKQALAISRNIPALKAFQTVQADVGNKKIVEFVEGLGIDLKDDVAYESYSIGGLSSGVSTLQMAAAYAAFANGGYYTEPYTVKSIIYRDSGEVVEFEVNKTQAMKDSTAYLITNALEYAAKHGFDGGTKHYKGTVAVKTGTSNYDDATLKAKGLPYNAVNDLWSVAYTPKYSVALWYGYDEISKKYYSKSSDGSSYKDPLMGAIMNCIPVTKDKFKVPKSVIAAKVEDGTWPAMKPSKYTPKDLIKTEYFISGTEPTDESPRFAKFKDITNLKTSDSSLGNTTLTWEYSLPEVLTEEYLNKYFKQSVFGKSSKKLLKERLDYNENTLKGVGFGIYQKNSKGELVLLDFTTDKSYVYSGSSDATLVVRVEYGAKNFKSNASDGVEVKVKGNKIKDEVVIPEVDKPTEESSDLVVTLTGSTEESANLGLYEEKGIESVKYKGIRYPSSSSNITYYLGDTAYTSLMALQSAVNEITAPSTITIKYKVKFKNSSTTVTRLVNLR